MSHPAMQWPLNVPVLSDGVVTLRAHQRSDIDDMVEMTADSDMRRFTAVPLDNTPADAEIFAFDTIPTAWNQGKALMWAIEAEGRYVGNVDVRTPVVADIGFAAHPWARGKGYMTRAVRLANDHALSSGFCEIVHWRAHPGNLASLRVAHACGFTLNALVPGVLNERGLARDAWVGQLRFGDAPVPRTPWLAAELTAGHLRLRATRESDAPRVAEACRDDSTAHWISSMPQPYAVSDAIAWIHECWWTAARGRGQHWAIADPDNQLLGVIGLNHINRDDPFQAEVGYWLHPDARGSGVMTQALQAVVTHTFAADGLDLGRLTLRAATANGPSNAVARRAGFVPVGVETNSELLGDGSRMTMNCYERLRGGIQ